MAFLGILPGTVTAQWASYGLDNHTIEALAQAAGYLYAATDGGLFRVSIDDPDGDWTSVAFAEQRVYGIANRGADTILVAVDTALEGDPAMAFFRSDDSGETWDEVGRDITKEHPIPIHALAHDTRHPGTFYAGGQAVVLKSADDGATWQPVWGNLDGIGMGVHFFAFDPHRPEVVWSGGETAAFQPMVLRSTDGGDNWMHFSPDLSGDNAFYALVAHETDIDFALAGVEGGVLRSTDGGENWQPVLEPEEYPYIFGLATTPLQPSRVYAAGWRRVEEQDLIVYVSDDFGDSWTTHAYGASGDFGVLAMKRVAVDRDEFLFLGTTNEGVFRFATTLAVSRDERGLPANFALYQNYPNPFNPWTTIAFMLPRAMHATLLVHDALGREVARLFSGAEAAGHHEVRWDASGLASGVYFYTLHAGSFSRTRKLILVE
jgi:hypothetical protein